MSWLAKCRYVFRRSALSRELRAVLTELRQDVQRQADAGHVGVLVPPRGPESVLFMAGPPAGASCGAEVHKVRQDLLFASGPDLRSPSEAR